VRQLVAGTVLEDGVRKLLGHANGRIHEAERRGEDEAVTAGGQLADDAVGVRAFGNTLHISGFHLVAELLLDGQAARIMLEDPDAIAVRTDIDEAHLERLRGRHAQAGQTDRADHGRSGQCRFQEFSAFHGQSPPAGLVFSICTREPACCVPVSGMSRAIMPSSGHHTAFASVPGCLQDDAWNGLPSDMGVFMSTRVRSAEMNTSAAMVIRYGSMARKSVGTFRPIAWPVYWNTVRKPNR